MNWIKNHYDQCLAAVTTVLVVLGLMNGWQTGWDSHQATIPPAREMIEQLEGRLNETTEEAYRRFQLLPEHQVNLAVAAESARIKGLWTQESKPATLNSGLFYHRASLEDLRDGRDLVLQFFPPQDLVATTDLGSVALQWRADPRNSVHVTETVIYRKVGEGAPAVLARLEGELASYTDKGVKAGVAYEYSLVSVTDEPLLKSEGKDHTAQSSPVHVVGKTDFEIRPLLFNKASKTLRVSIRKFSGGVWHEREFDLSEGGMAGARDPGSEVDFSTGCQVETIEITPEVVVETMTEWVFERDGTIRIVEGKPVSRTRQVERQGLRVVALLRTRGGGILRLEHNHAPKQVLKGK